ncbi:MAG: hypothetical protein KF773_09265 [Deltaproteobacteria bacterium]|nr:hypothetical protein [Deltaproteobacteria bacterium]
MRALWAVLALCACQGAARDEELIVHAETAPAAASCKPEAPVAVVLDARPVGGDAYAVTVRATPSRDVAALELGLVLPPGATVRGAERAAFGATASGASRTIVVTVQTAGPRAGQLTVVARVPVEGIAMSRTAEVTLGTPEPPPRTRSYRTADGELAMEVRP